MVAKRASQKKLPQACRKCHKSFSKIKKEGKLDIKTIENTSKNEEEENVETNLESSSGSGSI